MREDEHQGLNSLHVSDKFRSLQKVTTKSYWRNVRTCLIYKKIFSAMFKKKNRKKVWKHISKDVQVRLCRTLKHNRILCNSWEVRPNLFPKGYPDGLHIIFFQVYGNSCCLPRKQEGEKKWVQLSQARITAKNVVYSVRDLFFAVAQSSLSLVSSLNIWP